MHTVHVRRASYDPAALRLGVMGLMDLVRPPAMVKGARVLIKPNMLGPFKPEQAITTHPLIVRYAAEYALDLGASVRVSDSNAMGSFTRAAEVTGLAAALAGLPVTLAPLEDSRPVRIEGSRIQGIELAGEALDADVIVNLPKLKTHMHMTLTLAVKNLFGCVVGIRKPEWHFRAGEDQEFFADLLAMIYRTLRPSVNLMDGIVGMEGDGPGTRGTPRRMGVLLASDDALALDLAVCRMIGADPMRIPALASALAMGGDPVIEVSGDLPNIEGFVLPETRALMFGPRFMHGFLRHQLAARPVQDRRICRLCNECVKICPAKAVTNPTGRILAFDYDLCIRCYCCVEVCPHAAMLKHESLLKKALTRVLKVMNRLK
jgi:uncharacterized protein (DUF362 family)/Pyruvate/2-oxoacid:ferredoxin oxidoreductase delta subunit